jgi:hypothetical protein
MRRLASAALVAALAGCSAEGQFVNDPEPSPDARTSSAPSLPPGFTLGEREWVATSYGPDRKSAVVRTVEGGCTQFSHYEAREVQGSVQLVVYVALPPRGAGCTDDLRTPPHTVQLPRVLAPNETLLDGCPAAPAPSPPVSPDDVCGTLRYMGHTPAT